MLTGHGVCSERLIKIGRETTDICNHCEEGRDTVQHTLEFCPAWDLSRYTLCHVIGERLAPSVIVEAMLSGPQKYEARKGADRRREKEKLSPLQDNAMEGGGGQAP